MDRLFSLLVLSIYIGQGLSYKGIYLVHIISIITFLVMLIKRDVTYAKVRYFLKDYYPFITLFAIGLFSFSKTNAYYLDMARLCFGIFLVFILSQFKVRNKVTKIKKILLYGFSGSLLLSTLEVFTSFRWPWSPISPFKNILYSGSFINNTYPEKYLSYPTSFFWHPNNLALVNLVTLPFVIRAKEISKKVKLLIVSLVLFFMIAAGAKGALILSVIYLVGELVIYFNSSKNIRLKYISITVILSLIISVLGYKSLNGGQRKELLSSVTVFVNYSKKLPQVILLGFSNEKIDVKKTFDGSTSERMMLMIGALREYKSSPFHGIGPGQLQKKVFLAEREYKLGSVHNYWIEMLTVFGALGFLAYIAWYFTNILRLFNAKEYTVLISFILFFVAAPVMSSVFYFLPKWLLYVLVVESKESLPDSQQPSN